MKETNKIISYMKQLLWHTAVEFAMMMTVVMVVWSLLLNWNEIKISTLFSLLLVSLFQSFMQSIAFSEVWIKKMHYSVRILVL